jgi:hypothetical protein
VELVAEQESAEALRTRSLRTVGPTRLKKFVLREVDLRTGGVTAYACVDLSKVKVLNAKGKDVTPAERANRQTSVPVFEWRDGRLLLAKDESWSGESIC